MPNDAAVAEKNLRRKIQAWRRALYELVLYFLPPEFGGVGLGDLGIMCGNTNESLEKAKAIARKSGFSEKNPGFDVDGDGATTSWDIEAWLDDPSRSTVPRTDEEGSGGWDFDYGVTNGDRLMQEEYLRGELQRLRVMEMDLLHEALAGEFDKVGAVLRPAREEVSHSRTREFLARALGHDGWPAAAAIAAVGAAAGGGVVLVGYGWQVLRGGWTLAGASDVDAGVQASEAQRGRALDRAHLWNDLRRFGDRWQKDSNAPDQPPIHDDGPTGLVERVHRWSRALAEPFTRFFFCGSLLAPLVHDAAVLTWWRRVIADIDRGRLKPGRPSPVRLTRVAPVAAFSDDPPATDAPPSKGVAMPPPRVPSAPAASTPSAAGAPRGVPAAPPPVAAPSPEKTAQRLIAAEQPVPWDVLKDLSGESLAGVLAHNQRLGIRNDIEAQIAAGRTPRWTEALTASERGDMDEGRLTETQARALAADRGVPPEGM